VVNANWRYIFIINAILAVISLIGLAKNMPNPPVTEPAPLKLSNILYTYRQIFSTRLLLQGGLIISLISLPMISWIGLAPILVMKIMGKSFGSYIVYQSLVFGGFIISSISVQFIAGRISFYKLITHGILIAVGGLFLSWLFHSSNPLFIGGMFISSFGIGLFNGSIFRLAITATKQSNSMSAASLNIIQSLLLAGGLEILNQLCAKFNYSLASYTLLNLGIGGIMLVIGFNFAHLIKTRQWQ